MPSGQLASEQEINEREHLRSWKQTLGFHALVIALWIAAYYAGYLNTMPGLGSVGVSLWYLPAGIAMGAVIALGPSAGIDIFLASSIKSLAVGEPWIEQVHAIRGAMAWTLAGFICRRLIGNAWPLNGLRNSAVFISTALLGAVLTASGGVFLNAIDQGEAARALLALPTWIVGDTIGALTITPFVLMLFGRRPLAGRPLTSPQIIGSLGLVLATNLVAFGLPLLIPAVPVLWFLVILAPVAVAVLLGSAPTVIAVAATNLLFSPLAGFLTPQLDHFEQQLFLLVISLAGLLLSGALGERDSALAALQTREQTLAREVEARTLEIKQASETHVRTLASLSHDLRQPVQALSLYLELLQSFPLPSNAIEPASRALLLAARLRDLVQTVLGLARDDAGGPAVNWQVLPIQETFERLAVALTPLAQMEDVELTFVASTATVESDPVMLDRILGNLVENAIRHSHGRRVLVGCRRSGNDVLIHVIDDGRGMKSASALTASRSPGSGLSLGWGIITDTAAALDHALEILPTARGTNVAVTLPRAVAPADEAEAPGEAPVLSGSVLVIDDDGEIRDALAMTLRLAGLLVSTAADHASAMSRIAGLEQPPDFLIIDFNLPDGRYGTETYDAVTVVLGRVVPTIFMTGSTALADLAALRAYRWPVLLKPISSAQILEAAQAILTKTWHREPAH